MRNGYNQFFSKREIIITCCKEAERSLAPSPIRCSSSSRFEHSSSSTAEGKVIVVSIADTGIGIDPSLKDRLFEKFVTSSSKGTGLGLYLSRKIIEAHGGKIWVANEDYCDDDDDNDNHNSRGTGRARKKGARFVFTLPLSKKKSRNNYFE